MLERTQGGWGKREPEKREGKQREERKHKTEGGKTEAENRMESGWGIEKREDIDIQCERQLRKEQAEEREEWKYLVEMKILQGAGAISVTAAACLSKCYMTVELYDY